MWWNKKKPVEERIKNHTDDFFTDCGDDLIKMMDKVLENWPGHVTWDQLIYLQKLILIEQRKRLTDGQ